MAFLNWVFYNNPVRVWLIALVVAGFVYVALRLIRAVVERQLGKLAGITQTRADDIILSALRNTRIWFLTAVAVWAGALMLVLPDDLREGLGTIVILLSLAQIAVWLSAAIRAYVGHYAEEKKDTDPASVTTMRAIGFLGTVAVWALLFMMGLDNLGYEITALVTGLGIGGIAIALAVQNVLGDLFASLSIVLDKPFVYGDFIIVDDLLGTVEHVGLKTTRLRSLSGEQLVFSNSDLLNSRIRNFKRMYERRVVFGFGVVYQTPRSQLERIPDMVREAVEALPDTRFDRAHFKEYGDSSLNFEAVYFVLVPDFNVYMDRQQSINLELFRRFEEEGIDFAYPTRTLFVVNEAEAAS